MAPELTGKTGLAQEIQRRAATVMVQMPNAQAHLLPEAGATQERRLLAVRCSAVFGGESSALVVGEAHEARPV